MEEALKKPDLAQLTEGIIKKSRKDIEKFSPQIKERIETVRRIWDFLLEMGVMIEDELGSVGEAQWRLGDGSHDYLSIKIAKAEVIAHIPGANFSGLGGTNLYTLEQIHVKEAEEIKRLLEIIDQKGIPMRYII